MILQNDVRVTVRVDKDLKENADSLFERLGLNMSVAFNMFLRKAVNEDAIPFPVSTKNTGFGNGMTASYVTSAFNTSIANEIQANQQKGLPVAGYDVNKKLAYLEFANGTREHING